MQRARNAWKSALSGIHCLMSLLLRQPSHGSAESTLFSSSRIRLSDTSHRSALLSFLPFSAREKHSSDPQRYAPRPGALPFGSIRACPSLPRTTRSRLRFSAVSRQETHILTGTLRSATQQPPRTSAMPRFPCRSPRIRTPAAPGYHPPPP